MTTEESYLKQFYREYKKNARNRNISWDLDYEDFKVLVIDSCIYCGSTRNSRRNYTQIEGYFYMTGIDRVDSNEGYHIGNVVPCCKDCNFAKNNKTLIGFMSHVKRIYDYNQDIMEALDDRNEIL